MKFPKREVQAESSVPLDMPSGNAEIREFLLRRAKEKASSLRWNGYTLVTACAILATVAILELREVGTIPVAAVAVSGLLAVWISSQIQAKRIESQSLRDELRVYLELLAKRTAEGAAQASSTAEPATESPLTDRETEVLAMIAEGKSNKETAVALHISDQTVKNHISHIFAKLDVSDRTSAVLLAVNRGWIKANVSQRSQANT